MLACPSIAIANPNQCQRRGSIAIVIGLILFLLAGMVLLGAVLWALMGEGNGGDTANADAVTSSPVHASTADSQPAHTTPASTAPASTAPASTAPASTAPVPSQPPSHTASDVVTDGEIADEGGIPQPIEPLTAAPPRLPEAAAYVPQNGVIDIDLSEYAGYAGLIVANGGLEPNPDSFFAREYGFQVRLIKNEEEGWGRLNAGEFAASATTVDVLPVLGRQFSVQVPVLLAFSRGSTMIIADADIRSINGLKGKVIAASQFNEADFFIRYLAGEAGIPVQILSSLDQRPPAGAIGVIFYDDAFSACDAYAAELERDQPRLNAAVGWTPRTDEVVAASGDKARILTSNRNLLIVADVLCLNRGFAEAHPQWAQGIIHGALHGNQVLRDGSAEALALVAKSFGWSVEETNEELALVHLANLPENLAFFNETIDAAGSFGSIFHASTQAYGDMLRVHTGIDRFRHLDHLSALDGAGHGAGQSIAIAPIRSSNREALEGEALVSKDIRFFFQPNSADLEQDNPTNDGYLDDIRRFLQVSPGSVVLLRGHVDNARVEDFRRQGGDDMVRSMGLRAIELSMQRSNAVRDALLARHSGIDGDRIESIGRGWEEPAGEDSELNRRVEVQWFTLE